MHQKILKNSNGFQPLASSALAFFILSSVLSGCVRFEDRSQAANSVQSESEASDSVSTIKQASDEYKFSVGEEFNSYSVILRVPTEAHRFFRYQGISMSGSNQVPTIRKLSNSEYQDEDVVAGRSYTYVFCRNEAGACEAIKMVQLEVPLDSEIFGAVEIQKNETWKFGRLYLRAGSKINIKNYNLNIIASSITVDSDVSIQNFSDSDEAAAGQPGRDGGNLTLITDSLNGFLRIDMRGENGGRGQDGQAWKVRAENGQDGIFANNGFDGWNCKYQAPGNGSPGMPGQNGHSGKAGGFSGNVFYKGPTDQIHFLDIRFHSARGGAGGAGQAGQLGGLPGTYALRPLEKHEENRVVERCGLPPEPQEGLQGSHGSDGAVGASGAVGKLIFN